MLYGFSVYQRKEKGGNRVTASKAAIEMLKMLPFDEYKYAITEDGELLILDMDTETFVKVPEKKELIIQYGAGDLEEY